jgi:tricorn protease
MAPERNEIVFVSGGDIWRTGPNGGEASLLIAHAAEESRPLYSPDGSRIAFVSTRTGGGDIYVLTLASGDVKRLTFDDGPEELDAWSRDGKWLYYHSTTFDIAQMNDVYRVNILGGTPMPVAADRYANEFFAAPSPDGRTVALNGRGVASRQWWRKGHSHLDTSEIILVKPGSPPIYETVSDGGAKELWPMWASDGKSFFFVSDRTGVENIWRQPLGGTSKQVSQFKDGRVLWPTISYDGKMVVFERDFGIWKMDTGNGRATPLSIQLRGAAPSATINHLSLNEFDSLALSPDGKKIAVVAHGEIFAANAKDNGEAQRITRTHANEAQVSWSPDSRRLVYVSDRNGAYNVYQYDFETKAETRITSANESDASPRYSPDGNKIAYTRSGAGIWVYDLAGKKEAQLAQVEVARQPLAPDRIIAWSPDSKWLAFPSRGSKGFANIMVVAITGGSPQPVALLANSNTRTLAFSPDGRYLLFDTAQRTEERRIARVDLVPNTPQFREDKFSELFRPAETAGAKPTEIVFEGIRGRVSMLPLGLDVNGFELSADGKSLLLTAAAAKQENLYIYSMDQTAKPEAPPRQITSTGGEKSSAHLGPGAREVYFLAKDKVRIATVETSKSRPLELTAEMDVDFNQEKLEVLHQSWMYQRDHFFDEKFNGMDWDAMRTKYQPLIAAARTQHEVARLLSLMMGELNASHSGVTAGGTRKPESGYIGLRFDAAVFETKGLLMIKEVIAHSPAAIAGMKPGEYVTAVDGIRITPQTTLQELLNRKVDRRVEVTLSPAADGSNERTSVVRPIDNAAEKNLLYRAWVEDRRAYVERTSGGKLGYVHMADMSADSLERLYMDLDAGNHSKDGVVVDIRNNSGGFVNAYALDVFARRPYLTFVERGRAPAPARSVLGQRALELPTILITNQHSLSDAEDFSEGYRRLKIGKVVGEPTAGWIVYTWNQKLIDGSTLRMPRTKVFDNDGVLMEMHPRPVDIPVQRPIGESYTANDVQLDTAVRELLLHTESTKPRAAATQ